MIGMTLPDTKEAEFRDSLVGLEKGHFSRLDPLFASGETAGQPSKIVKWHAKGLFDDQPNALTEALTCACFLGRIETAEYLLRQGVSPAGGASTGSNAVHWAANRGQLDSLRLLLLWKAPLEPRSRYGGNVLDTAIWSSLNEPKPDHTAIIEALLRAGAQLGDEE